MKTPVRSTIVVATMLMCAGLGWAEEAFIIGVAPHTSARVILETYQPLRLHLQRALGIPVEILTAPDFNEFARQRSLS